MLAGEARKHVRAVANCEANRAARQIRAALADGELHPRWEDYRPPPRIFEPSSFDWDLDSLDDCPGELWKKIYIDWNASKAADPNRARVGSAIDEAEAARLSKRPDMKELRTLLFRRSNVERLWPLAPDATKRQRGPRKGLLARYASADRALFPKIKQLVRKEKISVWAAANRLATQGKVQGTGTVESRAKRLVRAYQR